MMNAHHKDATPTYQPHAYSKTIETICVWATRP
jgi:hypothetical protein